MDHQLRTLERQARTGDLTAAWRFLHEAQRLWDGDRPIVRESEWMAAETPYEELEARERSNESFNRLRLALHLVGSLIIEPLVASLNAALQGTGIPFNPIGIARTDSTENSYAPPHWWASLKERYSLDLEKTMFGAPVCVLEDRGSVPGLLKTYGLNVELTLQPNAEIRLLISDTFVGQKAAKWLGRGDEEESYRLSQIHGHYGGQASPASWVSQEEYDMRRALLRQRIVDAIYALDPGLKVRFSTGQGFEKGAIVRPSSQMRRSNPDADIRRLERIFQQDPTPENRNRLNAARNQSGLPPIEHEPAMQALLASGAKIRRVPGVQAQMALEDLNLVKITAPSARLLFNAGIPLVTVGNQINSYHFFDNTRQAYHIDSGRWIGEGRTFQNLVDNWRYYNSWTGQGKMAFFVNQSYMFLGRQT